MRRFLPSLSALQAFDSAARHLSFTRAAEDLSLTQSGISRQITNLEAFLGVRLFERTGSRLVMTDAGKAYAAEVRQSLDRLEEVSIDAVRGRRADQSLHLGLHPTFALRWLMPRLQRYQATFPALPLEVVSLEYGRPLDPETIDLAILRGAGSWPGTRTRELLRENLVVVASPALAELCQSTAEDIDFSILPTLQNAQRPSLWLQWLRATGRSYSGAIQGMRFPQSEMLIAAARQGSGLAVLPEIYVEDDLRQGHLVAPFGGPVPSGESYWIVQPETKAHRHDHLQLRDWLLREAGKSLGSDAQA